MKQRFPSPLLVVEASNSAGSVALFVDGALVAERDVAMGPSREDAILPAIAELLGAAHLPPRDVRAIACGSGPGSFTSLRIAASLAKGFAVANNADLFSVPSMLLAAAALHDKPGEYVLHSDALRGERYVVRVRVSPDAPIAMSVVARLTVDDTVALANDSQATLVNIAATSTSPGVLTLPPHARNVQYLKDVFDSFGPVDISTWEPEYGRLAEAQVKWETQHGRELPTR